MPREVIPHASGVPQGCSLAEPGSARVGRRLDMLMARLIFETAGGGLGVEPALPRLPVFAEAPNAPAATGTGDGKISDGGGPRGSRLLWRFLLHDYLCVLPYALI